MKLSARNRVLKSTQRKLDKSNKFIYTDQDLKDHKECKYWLARIKRKFKLRNFNEFILICNGRLVVNKDYKF